MPEGTATEDIAHPSLPSRKRLLLSAALSLCVVSLIGIEPAHSAPPQPNILIIVTDDERAVGGLGVEPTVRSWLKAGGTTFKHAYATTPYCCPSRASIITGLYAHNHGIMGTVDIRSKLKAVDAMSIFPSFQTGGYRVGLYGKYLNSWGIDDGIMNPSAWMPTGLDDYAIVPSSHSWYHDIRADGAARWDVNGNEIRSPDYSTTYIRESVISFIEGNEAANDSQPWLAYVGPIVPHAPSTPENTYANAPIPDWHLTPAQEEKDRTDKPAWLRSIAPKSMDNVRSGRARQLRSLMSVDDMISDIRAKLVELGEDANTIVIYTSDNGIAWGEHGRGGKSTPYLESVGVPLYIRGPGIQARGVRRDMVALLDLAPTLLTAAGIPYPRDFDGHDVFDGSVRHRLLLEIDTEAGIRGVPSWRAVLATGTGSPVPAYEFIRYLRMDGTRLENEAYDLVNDPWQLSNLHGPGGRPTRSVGLSQSLSKLMTCEGATCARFEGR